MPTTLELKQTALLRKKAQRAEKREVERLIKKQEAAKQRAIVKGDKETARAKEAELRGQQRAILSGEKETVRAKKAELRRQKKDIRMGEEDEEREAKKGEREGLRLKRYSEQVAGRESAAASRAEKAEKREGERLQAQENILTRARLRRLNPTAFGSANEPRMGRTGQEAEMSPEQLDVKQREESKRQLGELPKVQAPRNNVPMKPLKPNSMDAYQDAKIQERSQVYRVPVFVR